MVTMEHRRAPVVIKVASLFAAQAAYILGVLVTSGEDVSYFAPLLDSSVSRVILGFDLVLFLATSGTALTVYYRPTSQVRVLAIVVNAVLLLVGVLLFVLAFAQGAWAFLNSGIAIAFPFVNLRVLCRKGTEGAFVSTSAVHI